MFSLDPVPKIITFDCYGTLVQWREVLFREIAAVLASHGKAEPAETQAVFDDFSQISKGLRSVKPHIGYKILLRRAFREALTLHALAPTDDDVERLATSLNSMGPHPEVPGVLRKLRERYKLAIFTNSDDDLIINNVEKIGVPIDYVITAEQAQAYKPARQIFEYGHRKMGVTKDETIHVAMSMTLDMQACKELGIRGIWINRTGEQGNPDWLPYEELPDLSGVPALLLPERG
jgi:2-haloalkanoic acid dehalogenase type II